MTPKITNPFYGQFDAIVEALVEDTPKQTRFPVADQPTTLSTFIDLFCGIGGFHLAAADLGLECVMACDIDTTARQVYYRNFGMLPAGDIKDITTIPDHDILFAGLPCQPFSIIGGRQGMADPRGTLFYDVERIVEDKQPRAVVIENVKQFLTNQDGQALDYVASSLEDMGYGVDWKVLNALHFGLPQRRERVFIVAIRGFESQAFPWPAETAPMTPLADILDPDPPTSMTASKRIRDARHKAHTASVKPAIWHENKGGNVSSHPYSCALRASASYNYLLVDGNRRLTAREMLRLQGFPDHYEMELPITAARKLTGNAVPVPVVKAVVSKVLDVCR